MIARLRAWVDESSVNRAFWVRCLGELDDDIQPFLTHPDKDVRVCAALAPSVAHSETATEIIVDALSDEAERMSRAGAPEPDDEPVDRLQQYATARWIAGAQLYSLADPVSAALARAGFLRIAEPATTIIRHADWTGCDTTWGPLVRAAFPTRRHTNLPDVERDVVAALVANPGIWDYKNANVSGVFKDAGLPFQREACARIAQES